MCITSELQESHTDGASAVRVATQTEQNIHSGNIYKGAIAQGNAVQLNGNVTTIGSKSISSISLSS